MRCLHPAGVVSGLSHRQPVAVTFVSKGQILCQKVVIPADGLVCRPRENRRRASAVPKPCQFDQLVAGVKRHALTVGQCLDDPGRFRNPASLEYVVPLGVERAHSAGEEVIVHDFVGIEDGKRVGRRPFDGGPDRPSFRARIGVREHRHRLVGHRRRRTDGRLVVGLAGDHDLEILVAGRPEAVDAPMEDVRVAVDRDNHRKLWALLQHRDGRRRVRDLVYQQQSGDEQKRRKDEARRDGVDPDDLER